MDATDTGMGLQKQSIYFSHKERNKTSFFLFQDYIFFSSYRFKIDAAIL